MSLNELAFAKLLELRGLPAPETEHRFHDTRRWRFDYAWPFARVALEVEGGVWTGGRHNRAAGFLKDIEKYNNAALLGWMVVRCTPKDLATQKTVELLEAVLKRQAALIARSRPDPG
jgi:hypothetical protein